MFLYFVLLILSVFGEWFCRYSFSDLRVKKRHNM